MTFLLLRILCTVSFSHLLRLSQARTRRPLRVAAVNYVVAGAACAVWASAVGQPLRPVTLALGAGAGFFYVASLVLMLPAMRESGVSVTGAVIQLSMMLPVGVSIWRFREYPTRLQTAGIVLTLVALPLLSAATAVTEERTRRVGRGSALLPALLFLSGGGSQVLMKEFTATCAARELALYSADLFAAASCFTVLWLAVPGAGGREAKPPMTEVRLLGEWPLGILLGAVNMLQLVFLLLALRLLPGVVVFPVSASLGILVNAVASMWLWGERPPPAGWLGIAVAVVAVVLLGLK